MLSVTLDTDKVSKRVQKMLRRLRHVKSVEVGMLLSDWQTDDMHRHRPGTKRFRRLGKAQTIVRPHSQYEIERSRQFGRRLTRIAKRSARSKRHKDYVLPFAFLRWSQRPIVREELMDALRERVHKLAQSIRW
jgi:hypothetical protein